jgi:hypothetical protein
MTRRVNWGYWLCLVLLGTALSGCATAEEKQAYMNAQLDALKLQKPLLLLRAKSGESIELRGVEELAVHAPVNAQNGLIRQHQSEWAPVLREGLGIIGTVGGIYYGGQAAVQLADSIGRSAGTHINGSFNPSGPQSPINYYVGQGGSPGQTVSDRHDSVDDHSYHSVDDHSDRSTEAAQ